MLTRRAGRNGIPVIVLAGFLGAGKTTILNHILRNAAGARVAVIVNDFGSVNIDSLLIAGKSDRKLELTNGCICCGVDGGEFEETLAMALAVNPDAVIVEASGIAEPADLVRRIILSPNEKAGYGGLMYAVDALHYQETIQRHYRLAEHISLADLVVVTKAEHVATEAVQSIELELAKKTDAPIISVQRGELAPALLFDIPESTMVDLPLLQHLEPSEPHLHGDYQSVTFESTEPINPEKFKSFMNHPPRGLYRMKGFVYFGMAGYEQKFVLQAVGGRWDMYAEEWGEDELPSTTVVLIGIGLNESKVLADLRGAVGQSSTMIDIQRYMIS